MSGAAMLAEQTLQDLFRDHSSWLESWLRRRMGKRLLTNFYKRRSLEQAYLNALASLPEDCVPSPEQRWLLLETLQALDELLDGLPAALQRAFLWSQLEGLGYQQIAERLRVSERTVKRYMAQAYEHCLLVEL
ncbi:sigma-70 family RNA polymerase sigma factor [Pseudomonas sp. LS1212]|uniref:sigma-70 family RNA polymerase sigma factor n=1 Tax=Pseudomonas sp. LS1212 TaxID=2972478 RepID=UPI00215B87D2|nr:sigma-70 family RNA polymerase sigma factor [Pseudomonas sp. LS1212]UVJ42036.1 sigma-70 family RNA polymerase sigma factor [Pseudomonas sp. LS1212]